MTPSWYDVLHVEPTASESEIRAAWKGAIADLDPGDRRFRLCNQAAEVLLDPQRRAAYDAELAAAGADRDAADEPADRPAGTAEPAETAEDGVAVEAGGAAGLLGRLRRVRPERSTAAGPGRPGVPAWVLAVLAVLTAVSVGAAAWVGFATPSDASVEESTSAAQSAAERAIGPILSYDYRHLDEDRAAAQSYMTSRYREEDYDPLFEVVKQNAPGTKAVVKAEVVASGVVRSGEDRVEVLLFVNRPTTNKKNTEPVVYKDQVRAQMVRVDGDWLVDCLITSPNGHCD